MNEVKDAYFTDKDSEVVIVNLNAKIFKQFALRVPKDLPNKDIEYLINYFNLNQYLNYGECYGKGYINLEGVVDRHPVFGHNYDYDLVGMSEGMGVKFLDETEDYD